MSLKPPKKESGLDISRLVIGVFAQDLTGKWSLPDGRQDRVGPALTGLSEGEGSTEHGVGEQYHGRHDEAPTLGDEEAGHDQHPPQAERDKALPAEVHQLVVAETREGTRGTRRNRRRSRRS